MKEREKCKQASHHRPQCAKWFSRSQSQDFGQDGHCNFVRFQPHFHLNMTSQTQCCKTIKN